VGKAGGLDNITRKLTMHLKINKIKCSVASDLAKMACFKHEPAFKRILAKEH
jgi:hypothetical protein